MSMKLEKQIKRHENKDRLAVRANWSFCTSHHSNFMLNKMRKMPPKRQRIFMSETFSANPSNAMPVVVINMTGPTKASSVLI